MPIIIELLINTVTVILDYIDYFVGNIYDLYD